MLTALLLAAAVAVDVEVVDCLLAARGLNRWDGVIGAFFNMTGPFLPQGHVLWDLWESRLRPRRASRHRMELSLLEAVIWATPSPDALAQQALARYAEAADVAWASVYARSRRLWQEEEQESPRRAAAAAPSGAAPVHIAMIASVGSPPFGRKALATIRSALFFARGRPLRFHLVVDGAGEEDMRRAMLRLEPWLRARGSFDFIQTRALQHVWQQVYEAVPRDCLEYTATYGSVGWLRMFPHDVFRGAPVEVVTWVDAGDLLFLDDPARLLEYHRRFRRRQAVASPGSHVLEFQVFDLPRMRRANWSALVAAAVRTGTANGAKFCSLGEGKAMGAIAREAQTRHMWGYPHEAVPEAWSHCPFEELPGDGLVDLWAQPGKNVGEQVQAWRQRLDPWARPSAVWRRRMHPGLVDFMTLKVHCPTFPEAYAYQALERRAEAEHLDIAMGTYSGTREELDQVRDQYGQVSTCGDRARGVHFVRSFHYVPWAHHFMNFWAGSKAWDLERQKGDDEARDLRV